MNWKYLIPCVLLLAACETPDIEDTAQEEEEQTDVIVSAINPIEGTSEKPTVYTISTEKDQVIDLGNGGSLEIPANAFVDKDGNPISGKVDLQWQEFHTLGDILLSGIPMKYDSAGVQNDLVSGGMFSIDGWQNGEQVKIAPSKTIGVNVASIQDTPCYNFYEMDEASGKWSYETTKEGTAIQDENPADKVEEKADIIDVTLNTKSFPQLAGLDIVGWEAKRKLSDGEKSVLKLNSTKVRLIESEDIGLLIEAKTAAKQTMTIPVEPYTLDKAMKDSKSNKKELDQSIAEVIAYANELAAGRVIRSIEIDNFGTFNWDIIYKRDNSLQLFAKFNYPEKVNPQLVSLFLLSPEENAIVSYDPAGDEMFSFDPNTKNCIIAILPGNKVASVSNEGFAEARTLKKGQPFEFNLRDSGIKLKSSKDIMNHMNELI